MDDKAWKVSLAAGPGVVARYGDVVVLAVAESVDQEPLLDRVLAECRAAATDHPEAPGRRLVRRLAGLISQAEVDEVPTLGLLASLGADVAVFLVGDVDLEIHAPAGRETVSGRDVSTWLDRIVRTPFDALVLTLPGAGAIQERSDLGAGVVAASGVRVAAAAASAPASPKVADALVPAAAQAASAPAAPSPAEETTATPVPEIDLPAAEEPLARSAPERAEAPGRSATFESFALTEPLPETAEPLPVAADEIVGEDAVEVQGIMCSRRHFNDPTAHYCSACGISMVHQTHNLVKGVRPPLGVLVFDDGSVVPLNQDYVLGREPQAASEVTAGAAAPLQIEDPELKVSRIHARVQLKDWNVRVVDAGSANGTFVLAKGQTEWTRLVAEEPATIAPGTRVTMGGRTMEFDSHRK